ncbi:MAG: winged helix-turn-helix domain-containing protein [Woeseiaceae bacterium]|nr:winged helix-turn-helix domain-containing protein [Woeseiaceae bacterium]
MTGTNDSVFVFRGYRLDAWQRRLWGPDGEPLTLRPKEFEALLVLVRRAGSPVSKSELMSMVWPDTVVEENNLNQVISKLRQTLGDDRNDPVFIATITGRGYQFVAAIEDRAPDDDNPGEKSAPSRKWWWGAAAAVVVAGAALSSSFWPVPDLVVPTAPSSLEDADLVTESLASNSMPTLSPDGTIMAFVSDRSGTSQIWIKGLPNGNAVQLTDGPLPADSPSWSPVSDAILFRRQTADGVWSIWLVDALGTKPPRLIIKDGNYPRFAPDGRSFVFTRGYFDLNRVRRHIYIGNLDGGEPRRVDGVPETPGFADLMPAINANGDIAFVLAEEGPSGDLWLYEAATGEFRVLTRSSNDFAGVWARSPVWLPDNQTIIYTASSDDPANSSLWSVNSQGSDPVRVSTGVGGYAEPAVSRDGSRLVYSYAQPLFRLVRTDPSTGEHRTIHESRAAFALPAVSRDGKTIVMFGESVSTVPVDGGQPTQLTFGPAGQATLPAWSRSDDTIYYYRGRSLHRLDPETGEDVQILEDFHWSKQNWLAVHDNKLAYRIRSRWPGRARSVSHDLDSGEVLKFDDDILATDWSRNGKTLLGRRFGDYGLLLCDAETLACTPILNGEEEIGGAMPRWSHDEERVFFRRALQDKPGHAEIWIVSRDGGQEERLFELGPYAPLSFFFSVAHDDTIIWPQIGSRGNPEIWMTSDLRVPAER